MEETEFSRWLFEGRPRQGKNVLPDGLNWLCYFASNSKSHRENSVSFISLKSPHQVDMRNVVKSSKHFFGYFNTLETHSEAFPPQVYFQKRPVSLNGLVPAAQSFQIRQFCLLLLPSTTTIAAIEYNSLVPNTRGVPNKRGGLADFFCLLKLRNNNFLHLIGFHPLQNSNFGQELY